MFVAKYNVLAIPIFIRNKECQKIGTVIHHACPHAIGSGQFVNYNIFSIGCLSPYMFFQSKYLLSNRFLAVFCQVRFIIAKDTCITM